MSKQIRITVDIRRSRGLGGPFEALACVQGKGRQYGGPDASKSHACSRRLGKNPTIATARALKALGEELETGREHGPSGVKTPRESAVSFARRERLTKLPYSNY